MKRILIAAIAIVTLCAFASCQKDTLASDYYKSKISGTWKLVSVESQPVPTNETEVLNFELIDWNKMSISAINKTADGRKSLQFKDSHRYTLNGADLSVYDGNTPSKAVIESITEDEMVLSSYTREVAGVEKELKNAVFKKVDPNYYLSVEGLWEGVSLTGPQTYGDADHRWDFFAFDQFIYLSRNENGQWVPSEWAQGEYKLVADWLVTCWKENDVEQFECWNVAESSTNHMVLSALRKTKEGTCSETQLTLKRIR